MYNVKLDENLYYTGTYCSIGTIEGGINVTNLPPTNNLDFQKYYKYIDGAWVLDRNKNTSITIDPMANSMTLDEYKDYKQSKNKEKLATFLHDNPIQWKDGLYYGVTEADQNEMIADKTAYDFKHSIGQTDWALQWHSVKSACRDFTVEEFAALLNAIIDFVYPFRQLEMVYKNSIYSATTKEEVYLVNLKYGDDDEEISDELVIPSDLPDFVQDYIKPIIIEPVISDIIDDEVVSDL